MTRLDLRSPELLAARAPRYTSYPPATRFSPDVGPKKTESWLRAIPAGSRVSVYLHMPFCRRLCWFCACRTQGTRTDAPLAAYVQALERVRVAIAEAAVTVDIIDVGGGFPSVYPELEPPPLEDYFAQIHRAFEALPISYSAELWAEPGRALCAEYSSLIVRVEKRRGDELYINDGAYGALFDAAHIDWRFPVRALEDDLRDPPQPFAFYGPTCDDADYMKGPFMLPGDIQAGDYFEIGMLGAYGAAMKTAFNGFGAAEAAIVTDEPMSSLYRGDRADPGMRDNVVSLR